MVYIKGTGACQGAGEGIGHTVSCVRASVNKTNCCEMVVEERREKERERNGRLDAIRESSGHHRRNKSRINEYPCKGSGGNGSK